MERQNSVENDQIELIHDSTDIIPSFNNYLILISPKIIKTAQPNSENIILDASDLQGEKMVTSLRCLRRKLPTKIVTPYLHQQWPSKKQQQEQDKKLTARDTTTRRNE